MVGLILVSHGELAAALVGVARMILGHQEQLIPVTLAPDMTPEALSTALEQAIAAVDGSDGVLVLVDLFGGTPARVVAEQVLQRGMAAVAGANVPMLLEVCSQRDGCSLDQLTQIAYASGHAGVIDIRASLAAGQ